MSLTPTNHQIHPTTMMFLVIQFAVYIYIAVYICYPGTISQHIKDGNFEDIELFDIQEDEEIDDIAIETIKPLCILETSF